MSTPGRESRSFERILNVGPKGRFDSNGFFVDRMGEGELSSVKKEATESEALAKRAVLLNVAMACIADDRACDMGHVASQLMAPSGLGEKTDVRVARGIEVPRWEGELDTGNRFELGKGLLGFVALPFGPSIE